MKIVLCSTYVPFVKGGARQIVEWLEAMLRADGHLVEIVYLPESDDPATLYRQMMAFRWIDLDDADLVICFRPQAHMIRHRNKVLWFIHHVRIFYDLWDTDYRGFPDDARHRATRDLIRATDTTAIDAARRVFTNSGVVGERLRRFNGIDSEVLYPPIFRPERFSCSGFDDEVLYVARVEHHKRQHLLVEAFRHTTTPVRLRLAGSSSNEAYTTLLRSMIADWNLHDKVTFDDCWISEDEKAALMSTCLAVAYLPMDEDSYGYPTLEAAHSSKPVLTTTDSGGVPEFVIDGVNGRVVDPTPEALACALDELHRDRHRTATMGVAALARIDDLGITWANVLEKLLA
ncbi:MAG: glycosyltransferase family 4 protein [Actinomycetota bacterium]|nr:glycosyltransferase family 4 protein [Actinomycetota bacterium]